ncbi:MAG: DnaB-like helicase N-terminal domain-containing protein, partial [Pseudomonadota bacterium]
MADGSAPVPAAPGDDPNRAGPPHDPQADAGPSAPSNVEAEQALLGAILVNNEVWDRVSGFLKPEHFYDPVHARIYETAGRRIQRNALATAVTLKAFLEDDEGLKEIGGPQYLVRLAGAAISIYSAKDYAQTIYELATRRALMGIGDEIKGRALAAGADE